MHPVLSGYVNVSGPEKPTEGTAEGTHLWRLLVFVPHLSVH